MTSGLLAEGEASPVERIDGTGGAYVFVCEHASNRLPASLGDLGLPAEALRAHIAWDPGAAAMTRRLAAHFSGDAVLQRYSRLVVDCNRDPDRPDAISTLSETTPIPGNAGLSEAARAARIAGCWTPFHAAVEALVTGRLEAGRPTALVTVHSFTPVFRGVARPWHVGLITTEDRRLADPMRVALAADPALVVGDNEPYSAKDHVDYTIRRHGLLRGIPHVMIEVRNDLVADAAGVEAWADRLARAIEVFVMPEAAMQNRSERHA
ncbi:N-formylglutamate amidohydrolase [Prosthecomicrobium pneumaticum]|uniref:Putative N-formylglutamate amidohydrolase n=1 Tax=Prosthecomicrobium pneumaticum TaxID=81895 RepID=A0A7W9FLC3_9HYPH|nr:putative N-formylglutamate amidohydrolase [Prosthecomicrobium pneumaticum]